MRTQAIKSHRLLLLVPFAMLILTACAVSASPAGPPASENALPNPEQLPTSGTGASSPESVTVGYHIGGWT